jgi:uncharacterized protein (DUF1778 family)
MTKRKITAHKGNRTASLSLRLTTDEKRRLRTIAKQRGLSIADYIVSKVLQDENAPGGSGQTN